MAKLFFSNSISKNSRYKNNITILNRLIQWVYSKAEITSEVDWNSILKGANLIQVDWHSQSGGLIGAHKYMYRARETERANAHERAGYRTRYF